MKRGFLKGKNSVSSPVSSGLASAGGDDFTSAATISSRESKNSRKFDEKWGFQKPDLHLALLFADPIISKMRLEQVVFKSTAGEPDSKCLLYLGGKESLFAAMGRPFPQPMRPHRLGFPPYRIKSVPDSNIGLGVFADCDFAVGDMITSERALFILPVLLPSPASIDLAVEMLSSVEKETFYSLVNCKQNEGSNGIVDTNAMEVETFPGNYMAKYRAMFKDLSRINHREVCVCLISCTPNAAFHWDLQRLNGYTRACLPIKKGEQIFISYIEPNMSRASRLTQLQSQYQFTCECSSCTKSESEIAQSDSARELIALIEGKIRGPNGEYLITDPTSLDDFVLSAVMKLDGYPRTSTPGVQTAAGRRNVPVLKGKAAKPNPNRNGNTQEKQTLSRVIEAFEFVVSLAEKEGQQYCTAMEMVYGRLLMAYQKLDPSGENRTRLMGKVMTFCKVHGPQ
ncbi:hypothetical protein GYMLUDRAFT_1002311 [Collybiopsis luxurians FD-317 M1]|nr:hypothetical protein GYMLUDRAFT_1002311 [Collybiopsis luxurians FD-317 M1]